MGTFVPELTLNLRNMVVLDQGGQAWNVFADKYGVVGDGETDDWAGLQQWINDGITSGKKLILPPPPVGYLFKQPLVFNMANTYNESLGQEPAGLWLECQPGYNSITGGYVLQYAGPSNTSALSFLGIYRGVIKGVTINIGGSDPGVSGVVAFDLQVTDTLPNTAQIRIEDCQVLFQGTGGNHIGYRFGQSPGGTQSNISGTQMNHCTVTGEGAQYGSIGSQIGGGEVILPWHECCSLNP